MCFFPSGDICDVYLDMLHELPANNEKERSGDDESYPKFEDISSDSDDELLCKSLSDAESRSQQPHEPLPPLQKPSRIGKVFSDDEMKKMSVRR